MFSSNKPAGLAFLSSALLALASCAPHDAMIDGGGTDASVQATEVARRSLSIEESYGGQMAQSIMTRRPGVYAGWSYETATVLRGFELLYDRTGTPGYLTYIRSTVDSAVNSSGQISGYNLSEYDLDEIKEGSVVLLLYQLTGESRYATAAARLMSQLDAQPQTSDGGNWHKQAYPHQMWLDGLYMAQPFNAQYGVIFSRPSNFDDVVLQLQLMEDYSRDSATGLLYHGWDESRNSSWADPVTGKSPIFWGRALGWYAMALVDVLDFIPAERVALRSQLIGILGRLVPAIAGVQDLASGVWWQVIDRPGQSGNWKESSATAMFVYAIAKAVRLGYVDSSHQAVAQAGWQGLLNEFVTTNSDGTLNLTDTCEGTGIGSTYQFYTGRARKTNDPKGLGPFLMASAEMEFQVPNASPVVENPIADITLTLGAPGPTIDLDLVFSDPDGDPLAYQLLSPDANLALLGSSLVISSAQHGSASYSVIAQDGRGGSAVAGFTLSVVPVGNVPPILAAPIQDATLLLGEAGQSIDLDAAFSDANGDPLSYQLLDADLNVALSGNTLLISASQVGSREYSVVATDPEGASLAAAFRVTVLSGTVVTVNQMIQAETQTWKEATVDSNHAGYTGSGFVNTENATGTWFELQVTVPAAATFTFNVRYANGSGNRPQRILVNGAEAIAAFNMPGTGAWTNWQELSFTAALNEGLNRIRLVSLTSGGAANLDRIAVTGEVLVQPNLPPLVSSPLPDLVLDEGAVHPVINLSQVFSDPEGRPLSFAVQAADSNVSISGNTLTVTGSAAGVHSYTLTATDDVAQSVSDQFLLTVRGGNSDPVVVQPIANQTLTEGDPAVVFILDDYFLDPDGDLLKYSLVSADANVSLASGQLTVSPLTHGTASSTVVARDGNGGEVSIAFTVTVASSNASPFVVQPIANQTLTEGDPAVVFILDDYFLDPDGDLLTYSLVSADANVSLVGEVLTVRAVAAGASSYTVIASDGSTAEAAFDFDVTIAAAPGGVEIVLQAESQTWKNATVDTEHAGYTGSGFVNTENVSRTWVEFLANVPLAGSYLVEVRYANGSRGRAQRVALNGTTVVSFLNMPSTGAWTAWTEAPFTMTLSAGTNRIRFTSLTRGGAPNLDKITLVLQ